MSGVPRFEMNEFRQSAGRLVAIIEAGPYI
jgi:hypothetical protein